MKKLTLILMLLAAGLMAVSCGHDEPDDPNAVTRVQDGNGKVFLENGLLVEANLNYTQNDLINALATYEWERDYCFYYDNKTISNKTDISAMPILMHTDMTIEFDFPIESARLRDMSVSGKQITVSMRHDPISGSYYPDETLTVVALDLTQSYGRIVMDRKLSWDVDGYLTNSRYVRMVWKAKMAN